MLVLPLVAMSAPESDAEGAKDHPSIPRFPGFYIEDASVKDFDSFDFKAGENAKTGEYTSVRREGKIWMIQYQAKESIRPPSRLEVIRNYERAFKQSGGSMLWSDGAIGEATYRQSIGSGERWMELQVSPGGVAMRFVILEVAAMSQKVELSADAMLAAIEQAGFVALNGIEFDTGKASIRKDSESLLNEIFRLLDKNKALKISIQGHTDNIGKPETNLALSRARAAAVQDWLIAKGIAASRLSVSGFGDTKPIADNRTEAGRAKNRRVELVKGK